ADLAVVEFPGVGVADRLANAFVEVGIAQRPPAPILHALVEARPGAQLLSLGSVGEQLVLDQELDEHSAPSDLGQGTQVVADLSLCKLHVGIGDGLAVDLRYHALLRRRDRRADSAKMEGNQS